MKTGGSGRTLFIRHCRDIEEVKYDGIYDLVTNLENKYTLNDMELVDTQYNGYIPAYTRTKITDDLHEKFGFRSVYKIISKQKMRNLIKNTREA